MHFTTKRKKKSHTHLCPYKSLLWKYAQNTRTGINKTICFFFLYCNIQTVICRKIIARVLEKAYSFENYYKQLTLSNTNRYAY